MLSDLSGLTDNMQSPVSEEVLEEKLAVAFKWTCTCLDTYPNNP